MRSTQSWGRVFAAEFRRIILRTRTIVAIVLFALVSIGITVGGTTLMEWAAQQDGATGITGSPHFIGLGIAASFISFTTSMLCVASTSRDYRDGAAAATLVVVPRRNKLLSARIVVWAATALVVSLLTLLSLALMYLWTYAQITEAFVEVACGVLGTCTLVMVAFACATLLRKGALAMLTFLGIDIIIPMIVSMAGGFIPGIVGEILMHVKDALPGNAMGAAMSTTGMISGDIGPWIFGMVALVVWIVASSLISHAAFSRYAGASD